jgi:hypothetical protein
MSAKLGNALAEFVEFTKIQLKNNLLEQSKDIQLSDEQLKKLDFIIEATLIQSLDRGSQIVLNNTSK